MSEQEQFLNTIAEVLKPTEPTGTRSTISAQAMEEKLTKFSEDLEVKRARVNEMVNGYISTRNSSSEELEYLKEQINILFNNYARSFNK